jgi:hypothetical protein
VGEQLYAFIQERLGKASNGLVWDQEILRAWLPLNRWVSEFLQARAQRLDTTNWLSRHTHLRRIILAERKEVIAPGQFGRVCPYETPESPNIGRVFTISVGAEIRDGRLVIIDDSPAAGLGLSASMLPFLEHNDPNRLLFAANFLRQSIPAPNPEPALVQTGNEPDAPDFWCGRNLLTAYVSMGEATTEDAIVLSESGARRFDFPRAIETGDRLTNRHGIKGVVSRILPDDEMPHLPNGVPVELVYSFSGLPTRMVFGPVREALLGRIAHVEGQVAFAPPFGAPTEAELRERLQQAGLPLSGQETLTLGKAGPLCELPSTIGWVYWNRSTLLSQDKLAASAGENTGLACGELEFAALRDAGAVENIKDAFRTRSARNPEAASLPARLAAGPVEPAAGPTPWFEELSRRLQAAGILAQVAGGCLTFRFASPPGRTLKLARPAPHPWLRERTIDEIGTWEGGAYEGLVEANERVGRMLSSKAPERLVQSAIQQLTERLRAYYAHLLPPEALRLGSQDPAPDTTDRGEPQLFSARAVITPATGLQPDQVGLPDEIAWTLFGPQVIGLTGDERAVQNRTPEATRALERIMAESWVIVHCAPALTPTALLAFRPVRHPEPVIRLHPLACGPLNADFDGDLAAIYLPVTEAAQREAGEKLTLAAHLARDPGLVKSMFSHADLIWGLAWLNLQPGGRSEIAHLLGMETASLPELLSQDALFRLLEEVLQRDRAVDVLARMNALAQLGYRADHESGASVSPFLGSGLRLPPAPENDSPDQWLPYMEEVAESILVGTDYTGTPLGPQLLAAKTRARNRRSLPLLVGPRGLGIDAAGQMFVVRRSQIEGLAPTEAFAIVAGARRGLAQWYLPRAALSQPEFGKDQPAGWNVLARARRSKHPGIVFARAAASGEIDPLDDLDSRLLVGL